MCFFSFKIAIRLKVEIMNYIDKLKRNRSCIILSILFTFIWGMAAHGYMYFNNSISHDSLNEFIYILMK